MRRVASYRFLVVTGPRAGGRAQVVRGLETAGQQLLDLAADTADTTQRRFESRILHTLVWGCSRDRVAQRSNTASADDNHISLQPVWVIFTRSDLGMLIIFNI